MAFVLVIAFVLALLGALAKLTVGFTLDPRELIDGDPNRPQPLWFTRPGPVS